VRARSLIPIALLASTGAQAQNFFQRPDPGVAAANEHYQRGEYDQALRGYEDAAREHPNTPELDFNRGNALFKLDRRDEARAAYLSALAAPDGHFKAQDYYNLGNALWDLDRKDAAADAYQRSLMLDPTLEDARHNLELLLAPPPPQDGGSPDGGQGDGGAGDGGKSQGSDGGQKGSDGGQGSADGGQNSGDGGSPGDGGAESRPKDSQGAHDAGSAGQDGGGQPPPEQQKQQPQNAQAEPLDQQKSEQLLDALRQREKSLQLWKFRTKPQRTKSAEKDW
jgi:Ca-activated chloride channel family protein